MPYWGSFGEFDWPQQCSYSLRSQKIDWNRTATVQQHERHGDDRIMAWSGQRTELIIVKMLLDRPTLYIDQLFSPVVAPIAQRLVETSTIRPHRACVATIDILRQTCVRTLSWPAKSPDMSLKFINEHIWSPGAQQTQRCISMDTKGDNRSHNR